MPGHGLVCPGPQPQPPTNVLPRALPFSAPSSCWPICRSSAPWDSSGPSRRTRRRHRLDGPTWLRAPGLHATIHLLPFLLTLLLEFVLPARPSHPWRVGHLRAPLSSRHGDHAPPSLRRLPSLRALPSSTSAVRPQSGRHAWRHRCLGATSASEKSSPGRSACWSASVSSCSVACHRFHRLHAVVSHRRFLAALTGLGLLSSSARKSSSPTADSSATRSLLEVADTTLPRLADLQDAAQEARRQAHRRHRTAPGRGTVRYPAAPTSSASLRRPRPTSSCWWPNPSAGISSPPGSCPACGSSPSAPPATKTLQRREPHPMGLFSMFYGIYAPTGTASSGSVAVLMDVLRDRKYTSSPSTPARASIIRNCATPPSPRFLKNSSRKSGRRTRKRDIQNISDIIAKVDKRDPKRPFYGFMFFRIDPRPYSFPAEDVIRKGLRGRDGLRQAQPAGRTSAGSTPATERRPPHRPRSRPPRPPGKNGMLDNTIILFSATWRGIHGKGTLGSRPAPPSPRNASASPFLSSPSPARRPSGRPHPRSRAPTCGNSGITNAPSTTVPPTPGPHPALLRPRRGTGPLGIMDDKYKISFPLYRQLPFPLHRPGHRRSPGQYPGQEAGSRRKGRPPQSRHRGKPALRDGAHCSAVRRGLAHPTMHPTQTPIIRRRVHIEFDGGNERAWLALNNGIEDLLNALSYYFEPPRHFSFNPSSITGIT